MSTRFVSLAALALIALAAGFWLLTRDSASRGSERGGTAASPLDPGAAAPRASEARDLVATNEPAATDVQPVAAPRADARTVATTEYEAELSEARWIEGRVLFPPDTPADEKLRVIANGRSFEHGPDHAVDVDAGGRFRVAFSERTTKGRLELEGTYLYLEEDYALDLRGDLEPIVLEPMLGGALRGKVLLPDDVGDEVRAEVAGTRVKLEGYLLSQDDVWRADVMRYAELDEGLAFTFGGLSTAARYELTIDPGALEPSQLEDLLVLPGKVDEYDLKLRPGVTFAGRVLNDVGEPVNAAQVRVRVDTTGPWTPGRWRSTVSNEDGNFRLQGVTPGHAQLEVTAKGFEAFKREFGDVEWGTVHADLELALERGNSILGVVRFADGAPAEGALVQVEPEDGANWSSSNQTFRSDAEGMFAVTGLEPGSYRVTATVTQKERVTVISELTGKERQKTVRTKLRATATGVEAGTTGLGLVVTEGLTLAGSVTDDLGAPVEDFVVNFGRKVKNGEHSWVRNSRERRVKSESGQFEIEGLDPGTWEISVEADGYVDSDELDIEFPDVSVVGPLVLVRGAVLAGTVLDPRGQPLAGASIELEGAGARSMFSGFGYVSSGSNFHSQDESGRDGTFRLEGVAPGSVKLRASASGYASSEALQLTLRPGAREEGLTLRLGFGVRLTGVVVDRAGNGLPRRLVEVHHLSGPFRTQVQTDEDGAFEVAGITPGKYRLISSATAEELDAAGLETLDGLRELLEREEDVEVGAEGAHVVLAPQELDLVRVHGKVTAAGRPIEDAHLYFYGVDIDSVGCDTRADGTYEIALPKPAEYTVSVRLRTNTTVSRSVDVRGDGQRFDVALALGRLAGRVTGPNGPMKRYGVSARRTLDENGERAWGWSQVQTDEDGRYEFEELPAGTWTVEAGGRRGTGDLVGAKLEDLFVAAGRAVADADLVLRAGGTIEGQVRGSALSSERMRVLLRSEDGGLLDEYASSHTGPEGRFKLAGLEPGTYLVSASGTATCTGDYAVTVVADETTKVELTAQPGTTLVFDVVDADGAGTQFGATITRDGKNYELWGAWTMDKTNPGKRRFGALPPGTYDVHVYQAKRQSPVQRITLNGEPEHHLSFQLPPPE